MYSKNLRCSSVGLREIKDIDEMIQKVKPFFVCIDVANGYSYKFIKSVKEFHLKYPDITIIAGNVVTREITQELILECGVDIVKIGIGCLKDTTRVLMSDGSYKMIKDIDAGEYIRNLKSKKVKVLRKIYKGRKNTMKIVCYSCELSATPEHLIYIFNRFSKKYEWKQLQDISVVADMIVLYTKSGETLLHITSILNDNLCDVYDIEVDCPTNSFIANNFVVHNSGANCTTRLKTGVGVPQLTAIMECGEVCFLIFLKVEDK